MEAKRNERVEEQSEPVKSDSPAMWDLVMTDMRDRDESGLRKYGVRLQADNGRDVLVDTYQELLDAVVYIRQAIYERDRR